VDVMLWPDLCAILKTFWLFILFYNLGFIHIQLWQVLTLYSLTLLNTTDDSHMIICHIYHTLLNTTFTLTVVRILLTLTRNKMQDSYGCWWKSSCSELSAKLTPPPPNGTDLNHFQVIFELKYIHRNCVEKHWLCISWW
jgi:hypothetical protein